jgi:hypothetical protein
LIFRTDEDGAQEITTTAAMLDRVLDIKDYQASGRSDGDATYINITKNPLCKCGYLTVSKTESRINPIAPQTAKKIDMIEKILSVMVLFGASRPICRSQRSAMKARSKDTVVTALPAMKSGFNPVAPTSDMYLQKRY